MKEMLNMSMFEQIDKEIGEVNKEVKENTAKKTDNNSKKASNNKKSTSSKNEDPAIKIQKECTEYEKIVVKYFSQEILVIDGIEQIKNIKLEEIKSTLISQGYNELESSKIKWHLTPSTDKKTGYLFAVGDFFAKG